MVKPIGLITFGTVYLDNSRARIGPWVIATIGAGTRGLTLPPYTVHRAKHKISSKKCDM